MRKLLVFVPQALPHGRGSARERFRAPTVRERSIRSLLLLSLLLPAAHAQFALSVVNGTTETAVTSHFDFGSVSTGDTVAANFRLRNTANGPAAITLLSVAGAGFSLSAKPTLPLTLNPQGSADFTVTFQASSAGGYSAALSSDGIAVLLTAAVVPGLTYEVQTTSGTQPLGPSPVDFGPVQVGQTQSRHILVTNGTQQALTVPSITVGTSDFSLRGASPSGTSLQPGQQSGFDMQFLPTAVGPRTGSLAVGARTYTLQGTGVAPPMPQPQLTVSLPSAQSGQQGAVGVNFGAPAATSGSGAVTLQFLPAISGASDPAIAFASGGQTAPFTFAAGDTQATFGTGRMAGFQTGTTAGTIVFTAKAGGISDQQSVSVAAAPVAFGSTQASRSPGSVQVQVTGFDNTRTAGRLSFTFYDNSGNPVAPGAIPADAGAAFAQYFAGSSLGGNFLLRADFPVTGDTAGIVYFQAAFTNSAGTSTTARATLQ
jgi:Transmembrane protein 131-like N-terminal/HYDIN/CFA65/VesB-like, Ig-like domain